MNAAVPSNGPTPTQTGAVRIVRSAAWAAYGDVLGFISELTQEPGLRRRIGASSIERAVSWRRRIGGRFGVELDLPVGCYSDDTQLRLSTCRAIRADGTFDVEAFAKVELPVWLSYSLGAGRGTKAAATNLSRREVTWETNFYDGYGAGGGNGAAMRIQPHVWAAPIGRGDEDFLRDVVRNAIVTHGHPKGIMGAVIHALVLRRTIEENAIPEPERLNSLVPALRGIHQLVLDDESLRAIWLPLWQAKENAGFHQALAVSILEYEEDVSKVVRAVGEVENPEHCYRRVVVELGGLEDKSRGTGTKTAVLASVLAWLFARQPREGLLLSANVLDSDTDTIGTMAGAILGVVAPSSPPPKEICDLQYIGFEAKRMYDISTGQSGGRSFPYPDMLDWEAPRTQADALSLKDGSWALAGLGTVEPASEPVGEAGAALWQWFRLDTRTPHSQLLLIKRRAELNASSRLSGESRDVAASKAGQHRLIRDGDGLDPAVARVQEVAANTTFRKELTEQDRSQPATEMVRAVVDVGGRRSRKSDHESWQALVQLVIASGFHRATVGEAFLTLLDGPNGFEDAVMFAQALRRARKS